MDPIWLIISSALVFLMQAGFLCLESGKVRSKNSVNVATKNVADFVIAAAIYWAFGFGLMFGESAFGIIGTTNFMFGDNASANELSFFLFQLMFCGTTATLLSGAVAERMSFFGYLVATVILSTVIFPVVGHWIWYSDSTLGLSGWLNNAGFVDFAGATVVHSVGGWVALAAIIIIGPRLGRFTETKKMPSGSNIPLATLGVLLIWFGWFGFNGGSTLAFNDSVPLIIVNTCLSAVFGAIGATTLHYIKSKRVDITFMLNGVIAGLVSVTAAANAVSPGESAFLGLVGGSICCLGIYALDKLKLDDALYVIPAHLIAGIWGTLGVAFFGDPEILDTGLTFLQQLRAQIYGIVVTGVYAFCVSYLLLILVNKRCSLRVSAKNELIGMNISEHGITTEMIDLLDSMKEQESGGTFGKKVSVEPFTEVGQIAQQYNRVIGRVNQEIKTRDDAIGAFKTSEGRKLAILQSSMDSIITVNNFGEITEFNPAAEKLFGYMKKQALGKMFDTLLFPIEVQDDVAQCFEQKFSSNGVLILNRRNTIQLKRIDNELFPAEVTITSTDNNRRRFEYTFHIRNIAKRQKMQTQLRELAFTDSLTGLHNRAFLLKSLEKALAYSSRTNDDVALLFLDLDRFKYVNDTLGHKAGDTLLCELAKKLKSVTRDDDIISRWGGDEFIVMMVGQFDEDILKEKANDILLSLQDPVSISSRNITLQTSIGISVRKPLQANIGAEMLIQQADLAMYASKQNQRNQYRFFSEELAKDAKQLFDHEQELKLALKANNQISMVYQLQYDGNKEVVGMEALVRWNHPEKGNIPPNIFVEIAEQSELIIELGELTISLVFEQINQWQKNQTFTIPVAINLSGRHLLSHTLLGFVSEKLEQYNIDPMMIEFEITEGVMLEDVETCIANLTALKNKNIRISIDDFGTGYSSLAYLKRLPIDVLKIDRTFVMDAVEDSDDKEICATVLNLAKGLELTTIAEGIETKAQFDLLKSMGCDYFQGYWLAKPKAAELLDLTVKSIK